MSRNLHSRQRAAFATILILMLLFMMLMLTITYLRVMRAYSVTHPQLAANADPILLQLEGDIGTIIGADGKIGPVTQQNPQVDSAIQEPYDYPWTNTNRFVNDCRLGYPQVQTSKAGMGDPNTDDSWLAPCEPEGPTGSQTWAQVSNVMGSFLVYDDATLSGIPANSATREFVPSDAPAGAPIANLASGNCVKFRNLSTDPATEDGKKLVDTDGDGVGDALWFYPKNNLAGGLRYVAAVRIVDTSGMVNLNTALGELPGDPRKGEGPYEINPTATALGFPAMTDASKLFRFPAYATAPATPLAAGASDYGF